MGILRSMKAWHTHLHEYRYGFLFVSLITYLVLIPFVEQESGYVIPVVFFLVIYFVLDTLDLRPRVFWSAVSVGFASMVLHLVGNTPGLSSGDATTLELLVHVLYLVFIGFCVIILMRRIFGAELVTGDTIRGGIAVYLLAGLAGGLFYDLFLLYDPDALGTADIGYSFSTAIYFSFVTMTTLGFGDITPKTPFLKTVVYLHATLGQLYLAVLVARLVGMLGVSKKPD